MLISSHPEAPRLPASLQTQSAKDYVVVELAYNSGIAATSNGFRAPVAAASKSSGLNDVLEGFNVEVTRPHFQVRASAMRERATSAPSHMPKTVSSEFAMSGVVQIVPRKAADAKALAKRLNQLGSVWKAYVAAQPVPAAVSPNMEPCQGYLCSSPTGIGAPAAWAYLGGRGEGVAVCDIEGDWDLDHEDLPNVKHIGGTRQGGDWRDHGTAVLGEILAKPSGDGVVGIAHRARGRVHSGVINGVWNTAGAISAAVRKMKAGDVILIELQAPHPVSQAYVAMQFWDDVYSAIRAATEKGITVVQAAGNADQDFDSAVYKDSNLRKDSGAIVVGAGIPPYNLYDSTRPTSDRYTTMGVARSRCWFSNYGKIVNVQGYGEHVTTLGYGDAAGITRKTQYTHRFSGTSSASPIVTGAVACLQGMARHDGGTPFTPAEIRDLLVRSGTPQTDDPERPKSQKIGPLPNLEKAIALAF